MSHPKTLLTGLYSKVILFSLFGLIACALFISPMPVHVRAADTYVIASSNVTPPPQQGWKSTPVKPPPKQGWKFSPSPKTSTIPKTATAVSAPKKSGSNFQTPTTGAKTSSLPKPSGSTTASKKETAKTSPKQQSKTKTQSESTYVNATGEVVPLPKGMKPPPKQGWKSSPSPKISTTPKTEAAVNAPKKPSGSVQASTSGAKTLSYPTSYGSTTSTKKEITKAPPKQVSKGTPQSIASLEGRQIELNRRREIDKLDSQLQELDRLKSKYGGRDPSWDQRASDAEFKMNARKEILERQSTEWRNSHPGVRETARQNILESKFKRISKEYGEVSKLEAKLKAKTSLTDAEERKLREHSKKADELMKKMIKTNEELNGLTGERKILVEDERGNYGTFLRGEGYQGEERRARGR
ncbi:MAG: hypothetical protein FJ122_02490 [Deltaproteobacteria bacterium]|nr:hypothetical protein [Deltaproteobacteria bacterium]